MWDLIMGFKARLFSRLCGCRPCQGRAVVETPAPQEGDPSGEDIRRLQESVSSARSGFETLRLSRNMSLVSVREGDDHPAWFDPTRGRHYCLFCGSYSDMFEPFGQQKRPNVMCPTCRTAERHRLLWLYLKERTDFLVNSYKVLDIAPMDAIQNRFKSMANIDYISVDLFAANAMRKMDICRMEFADDTFDAIFCYHVLEHVPDDIKAMKEMLRVLKPGGWAIIQVPLRTHRKVTVEGPDYTPEQRFKEFGQSDHVRDYGLDYGERLKSAGFDLTVDNLYAEVNPKIKDICRLPEYDEPLFVCRKPLTGALDSGRLRELGKRLEKELAYLLEQTAKLEGAARG